MSSFVDSSLYRRKTVEVCLIHQCGMAATDGSDRRTSSIFGDIAARTRRRELSTSLGAVGIKRTEACRYGRPRAMILSATKLRAIVNLLSDPGSAANAAGILARKLRSAASWVRSDRAGDDWANPFAQLPASPAMGATVAITTAAGSPTAWRTDQINPERWRSANGGGLRNSRDWIAPTHRLHFRP
jgi:hypothetical protein